MFNVNEAVDELINDINVDYYESCYDAIYEELCDRVDYGELTIEEAEMINEAAAYKYLYEAEDDDKALETDDDKKKKKKINKKKLAAGIGLAIGAGTAIGAKRYVDKANKDYENYKKEINSRVDILNPGLKNYTVSEIERTKNRSNDFYDNMMKKTNTEINNYRDVVKRHYNNANKLGRKKIADAERKDRLYYKEEDKKRNSRKVN